MSHSDQLSQWQKNKTLLRVTTVEKGKGHQVHVGNVIFSEELGKSFLFYDLDQKRNYNFSLNEIEEIQPYETAIIKTTCQQPKIEVFKDEVRDEVVALIKELPSNELYALVPILQLLAKKKSQNKSKNQIVNNK